LLRADGRSVYQRHGGTRYATRAQLVMEERMVTHAGAGGAPRVTRAQAAQALGADPARLEDALAGRAHDALDAQDTRTGSGLREDQAAAALTVLADGRLVSVINAPAGAGKTRVLAEAARIWAEAGLGPVIGITPSQSARNTLAAGVPVSYNAAQFLGHLPGRRGARGPVRIGPGTLLVIDEASMLSGPDLADLIAYAKSRGAKVILAGDVSQLHSRVRDARRDFLHKTSTDLVRRFDAVAVEDLAPSNMVKNRSLAKSISRTGWAEFRTMLTYKAHRGGRNVAVVDRWFPRSKTCSACGYLLAELSLGTRHWTCPGCSTRHDRDINAAKNLVVAAGLANTENACGADVRRVKATPAQSAVKQETRPVREGIPRL
jgi:IS605 OrfB family transposase